MGKYAGFEWLKRNTKREISPLGECVAELLGEWAYGLYHLDKIENVNWSHDYYIEYKLSHRNMATFDGSELTRLVFLAHWRCIRVSIRPGGSRSLVLLFHGRQREGGIAQRHPRLDQAVEMFKQDCSLDEVMSATVEAEAVW